MLTTEDCLSMAQEYIRLAQNTENETLRSQYLLPAKELTEIAALLDANRNRR